MADRFSSFFDLKKEYQEGTDYTVSSCSVSGSSVLIAAIHGGEIEPHTCTIAQMIAEKGFSLYQFRSLKGNFSEFHISSTKFDEPRFDELAKCHQKIISIHGCKDGEHPKIFLGGLDERLKNSFLEAFDREKIPCSIGTGYLAGKNPQNVCNRGTDEKGIQLEIPRSFRDNENTRKRIADITCSLLR